MRLGAALFQDRLRLGLGQLLRQRIGLPFAGHFQLRRLQIECDEAQGQNENRFPHHGYSLLLGFRRAGLRGTNKIPSSVMRNQVAEEGQSGRAGERESGSPRKNSPTLPLSRSVIASARCSWYDWRGAVRRVVRS